MKFAARTNRGAHAIHTGLVPADAFHESGLFSPTTVPVHNNGNVPGNTFVRQLFQKLTLTPEGVQAHEAAVRAMRRAEELTCRGLTEGEREEFMRICDKLTQNAEESRKEVAEQ